MPSSALPLKLFRALTLSALTCAVAGCAVDQPVEEGVADASADSDSSATDTGASNRAVDDECASQPDPPQCPSPSPAPRETSELVKFAAENAVPLRCVDSASGYALDHLLQQAAGNRVVIMGEIHGSNELGPLSGAWFSALVDARQIDTLALEMGMDLTAPLEHYLETGDGNGLDAYDRAVWHRNSFWATLSNTARNLREAGKDVHAFAIDMPWSLAAAVTSIEAIASALSDRSTRLLDGLPAKIPYGDDVDEETLRSSIAYAGRIDAELDSLCSGIDERSCLDIERWALGLSVTARFNAPVFWSSAEFDTRDWSADRERLIFLNYRAIFLAHPKANVYAHMGGVHACQAGVTVGAMLAEELELTRGRVFSTWPVSGPGGKVLYNGKHLRLDTYPVAIADAFDELQSDAYWLTSRTPGFDCADNPFASDYDPDYGVEFGPCFDGFIAFRALTPQDAAPTTTSAAALRHSAFNERLRAADRQFD